MKQSALNSMPCFKPWSIFPIGVRMLCPNCLVHESTSLRGRCDFRWKRPFACRPSAIQGKKKMMMNGSVKRAHEETKVMENKHLLQQQQQQQQVMVVDAGGENVAAETTSTMRPSKVARREREVDVKQGGHHHHHHHHEQLPPPLLPVFHHKQEIPSLETMTGGGVREATTTTLQQQQLQGRESKQQIKFVQQEQQVREFLEERTDERRIERDAQGSSMPDSSNRGLGQEATTAGGSSNGETLIPDLHPTRKSPPVEQEGKKQLWELQEASGENRVESSFFKEEKEKEAAKEREKKDETVVAAAAVRDRNDRKEENTHAVLHHPPSLLPEQKGAERDQREREKAAAAEKEKEKDKVHGNKDWGRDKGKAMSRDKREKRDKEELKDHQGRFVDQEHTPEKKEDINVAVIKEQELSRTQQPAGERIESQKASVGKEGREGEGEREGEKREDDWDRENKRKRMWESEKDNNRQLGGGGGSPERGGGIGGERHRDNRDTIVNHDVQQRARLLQSRRHSSPAAPRDLVRTYPRVKENEVTHGPLESSALLYRIGEGMPELTMLWKDYEANAATVATESKTIPSQAGFTVEIRIPADLATTSNRQIRGRQLWGTDIYTDDSDIVAVLMHTGYYTPMAIPPPRSVSKLQATIQILPPQETYTSMLRNSLRSRAWGGGSGCSYRVERCQIIKVGGSSIELEPCLTRTPAVAPTLAPAASEHTVTTRAACSNAYLQQRLVREVTIQYNLCNEPWCTLSLCPFHTNNFLSTSSTVDLPLKYSMSIVADRGLKKSQYTSARLKKGDVLYMETHRHRYELAYLANGATCNGTVSAATVTSAPPQPSATPEKAWSSERAQGKGYGVHNGERVYPDSHPPNAEKNGQGHSTRTHNGDSHERYRWSRCLWPLPLSAMRIKGVPSPPDNVEVLQDRLAWEEVKWSPTSVWVRGVEYPLARAQFLSPHVEDSDD